MSACQLYQPSALQIFLIWEIDIADYIHTLDLAICTTTLPTAPAAPFTNTVSPALA